MSDCKAYLREIDDVSDGVALGGGARAHVTACRACGERLRERESLRGLVRGLGRVEAPADFEFRLRARMAGAKGAGKRGPFGGLRAAYRLAPVAVAACFLIVSASLYVWQSSRTGPPARTGGGAGEVASTAVGEQGGKGASAASVAQGTGLIEEVESEKAFDSPPRFSQAGGLSQAAVRSRHAAARRLKVPARSPAGADGAPALRTAVASLNSAEVIRSHSLVIPLETASAPLRLVVRDERGAQRVVPLRAVSFGAQELIAREGARRQTTEANDEGVW